MYDLFDGSSVNIFISYIAGFITFFASCLLPLVPTYLAYLSGVTLRSQADEHQKWSVVQVGMFFVLGFTTTFFILGLLLNQFSYVVAPYRDLIQKLAGILFIILGLFMFGVFKSQKFSQERRIDVHGILHNYKHLHSFLAGVAFGFGWTPCIGPVLAVILYWSANQANMWNGMLQLFFYSLGLGTPFLLVAIGFDRALPLISKYSKVSHYVTYISAGFVMIAGLLLLLGQFQALSHFLIGIFNLRRLAV